MDTLAGAVSGRDWLRDVRRVVVKVGSRALVDDARRLDEAWIAELVGQIARVRAGGGGGPARQVVLVSSGAIAAGLPDLGLARRPKDLPSLQAAAALGQARLIELYRELFAAHGIAAGQVLLTHADVGERERHLNARNTLSRLLDAGAVPVINENDTVAVEEIRFGDNDRLAAMVAGLVRADLVVLLTTVDGFYTKAPEAGGELIARVAEITPEVRAMAGGVGSDVAVGGMRTKLDAAEMVMRSGERLIIAGARTPDVLARILSGEELGTVFDPRPERAERGARLEGRKRWIAFFRRTTGVIQIDAGAARALRERGGSLLAIGVRAVGGEFSKGEPVKIVDERGVEIARGLVNYGAGDVRKIAGKKSGEFAAILGGAGVYEEVVHRDNLVLA